MAPFQATIGWKRMRKEENKNYRFIPFVPDAYQKIKKKMAKKLKKLNNTVMAPFRAKIG